MRLDLVARAVAVRLSRRNLRSLLLKLDEPDALAAHGWQPEGHEA